MSPLKMSSYILKWETIQPLKCYNQSLPFIEDDTRTKNKRMRGNCAFCTRTQECVNYIDVQLKMCAKKAQKLKQDSKNHNRSKLKTFEIPKIEIMKT